MYTGGGAGNGTYSLQHSRWGCCLISLINLIHSSAIWGTGGVFGLPVIIKSIARLLHQSINRFIECWFMATYTSCRASKKACFCGRGVFHARCWMANRCLSFKWLCRMKAEATRLIFCISVGVSSPRPTAGGTIFFNLLRRGVFRRCVPSRSVIGFNPATSIGFTSATTATTRSRSAAKLCTSTNRPSPTSERCVLTFHGYKNYARGEGGESFLLRDARSEESRVRGQRGGV